MILVLVLAALAEVAIAAIELFCFLARFGFHLAHLSFNPHLVQRWKGGR
jgi:hypothetical protein